MVSLWGSKKSDGQRGQEGGSASNGNGHDRREPDENTRLLQSRPPPPHSDGYLDPDDPAVNIQDVSLQIYQN
jgi:hypothetical protein